MNHIIKIRKVSRYDEVPGYYSILVFQMNTLLIMNLINMIIHTYFSTYEKNIIFIRGFIYAIPVMYCLVAIIYRGITIRLMRHVLLVALTIFLSICSNPQIIDYLFDDLMVFLLRVMVSYFLLSNVTDYEKIVILQLKYIPIVLIYAGVFLSMRFDSTFYMPYSYALLVPAIIYTIYGYEYKKILYGLTGIVLILVIGMYGARGAFASSIIAVGLFFLLSSRFSIKKIVFAILGIASMCGIVFNINTIINFILKKFGYSRTLMLLMQGKITSGGGRSVLQNIIINKLSIWPQGLFADRFFIAEELNVLSYPHNLFLEIISQFGYALGISICLFLIWIIIQSWRVVIKESNKYIIVIFYSIVISYLMKALYTDSYLIDYYSGMALGTCVAIISKRYYAR